MFVLNRRNLSCWTTNIFLILLSCFLWISFHSQFEDHVMDICFEILDNSNDALKNPGRDTDHRCEPVHVSRMVTAMVKICSEHHFLFWTVVFGLLFNKHMMSTCELYTVIQHMFFCLPRWTQTVTWVCWQVAGRSRILMVLHHIDGLAVCQSFNSGERLGWGQSNMASAGCLQESHAQVGLSQLNQWHHSQWFYRIRTFEGERFVSC